MLRHGRAVQKRFASSRFVENLNIACSRASKKMAPPWRYRRELKNQIKEQNSPVRTSNIQCRNGRKCEEIALKKS
jgi:hypothetical protein